jgi:hypothetical protein
MGNELVRRLCTALGREGQQAIGKKGTPWDALPCRSLPAASCINAPGISGIAAPPIIEVARFCAIYDGEISLSRLEWRNGKYEYSNCAPCPKHQRSRYAPDNIIALPADFDTDTEQCACCLTWSPEWSGAVLCCKCGQWLCWGRVSLHDQWFRCRASCGFEGRLTGHAKDRSGFVPGRGPRNFGMQF